MGSRFALTPEIDILLCGIAHGIVGYFDQQPGVSGADVGEVATEVLRQIVKGQKG